MRRAPPRVPDRGGRAGLAGRAVRRASFRAPAGRGAPPARRRGTSPAPFPSSYDLRASGRVTPVRSQEDFGTCWIMAATGSLESATLTAEGRALDFSENNLADHMASRLVYEGMAPSELAAAYYARWEGPVLESSDPYPRPGRSPEYLRAVRHVQEVLFLPQRAPGTLDNDAVKWAVMTYGGVDAAIDFDINAEDRFWNAETSSYYDGAHELDHHVLCVGWDDAYSAADFAIRPPGDGAFLIKNSWGTGLRRARVLLALLLRRELRQGAGGVRRRRVRGRLRRHLPVRRARAQRLDRRRRRRERVVREPLLRRRFRRRRRGLVLHPRPGDGVRGPRRRLRAGRRVGAGRRRRHGARRRLSHHPPRAAGGGHRRPGLRRRGARDARPAGTGPCRWSGPRRSSRRALAPDSPT